MSRLTSLDAFRGLTVAAMLVVNNPGSWAFVYPPLLHAEWNGWTATDLIFPFFLFIVGVTTQLSLTAAIERGASRRDLLAKILRRGTTIVLLGLALHAFPFFASGKLDGISDLAFGDRVIWQFAHLRIPGVLQRIGIVYLLTALLWLVTTTRTRVAALAALLLGYWILLTVVRVPDSGLPGLAVMDRPEATLPAWVDRAVFGSEHLWAAAKTWDPEGLLSTLGAIATAILGVLAARWLTRSDDDRERGLTSLFAYGALLATAGLVWNWWFPINKNLWTSSYVLFTGGVAMLTLATMSWMIDVRGRKRWTAPLLPFGVNPMLAFVASGIAARLLTSLVKVHYTGKRMPLQAAIYRALFASWLEPHIASLAYALTFTAAFLLLLWPLHRKGIIWKVG